MLVSLFFSSLVRESLAPKPCKIRRQLLEANSWLENSFHLGKVRFEDANGLSPCWDADRVGRRSWANCCAQTYGPGGNTECWEPGTHINFDECCLHTTGRTLEGFARIIGSAHLYYPLLCPPSLQWLCDFAVNRTARARRTRRFTKSLSHVRHVLSPDLDRSIPVLGWPVAYDPDGLSLRLLRALDYPVKNVILIATGEVPHLDRLVEAAVELRPDIKVFRIQMNLGCAGGWNEIIHVTPEAPWWLIASHDVVFPPGALASIAERTWDSLRREEDDGDAAPGLRSFSIRGQMEDANTLPSFTLTRQAVAQVGLFDENFFPGYAEDHEYLLRMRIINSSVVGLPVIDRVIEIIHGPEEWSSGEHYSGLEQFLIKAGGSEDAAEIDFRQRLSSQLVAADNYNLHLCQKFGPLARNRPNCDASSPYADGHSGPFGVPTTSWDDWILDPGRRLCIYNSESGVLCSYDIRVQEIAGMIQYGKEVPRRSIWSP